MMAERNMNGTRLNCYPRHASELTDAERDRAMNARPCIDDRERAIRLGYLDDAESAAPDGPWFTLRVALGREKAVESELTVHGIEAFVPMRKGPVRRVRHRLVPAMMIPAVTGYVMVRMKVTAEICAGLTALENVIQLVGTEGAPFPVSHKEIMRFRAMADEGKLDWETVSARGFKAGEHVRIKSGPFGGFQATVLSDNLRGRGDVVVEAEVLGGRVPVTLPLALLEIM